jgi:TRAP-type mannitol/chloroaromatic compound transport system permease small subunit
MNPWLRTLDRLAQRLEAVSEYSGRAIAWLAVALVLLVSYNVGMRYLFHSDQSVAPQELEWHLFALLFLFAAAYTFKYDDHVRVDILYQRLNARGRAWVDFIGGVTVLLPFCLLIIMSSWSFVGNAFVMGEGSPDPGGLPYRYLLKAAIPGGFALLALQAIASILRNLRILLGGRGHPYVHKGEG